MADLQLLSPIRGVLKMPPDSAPLVFGVDPIWHGRKTEVRLHVMYAPFEDVAEALKMLRPSAHPCYLLA